MVSFEEKLYRLEQKKKEYHKRLKALPEKDRQAVEDYVWEEASQLTQFHPFHVKVTPEFQKNQNGLYRAFSFVRKLDKNTEITPLLMMQIHQVMLGDVDPRHAGVYRHAHGRWLNSTMIMSNWASIPDKMNRLCDEINANAPMGFYQEEQKNNQILQLSYNPIVRAIEACYSTVATHPFADANKRMARVGMALILSRANHIPMSIFNKAEFVSSVENYNQTRQPHNFMRVMLKQMDKSYEDAFLTLKRFERSRE